MVNRTAIEFYKEFNKNEFYKHYIQNSLRDMRQLHHFNNVDYLNKSDDPSFGLFQTHADEILHYGK